jgi:hypothetical protein
MFAHLDKRVLVVDANPKAELTESFLEPELLRSLWGHARSALVPAAGVPLALTHVLHAYSACAESGLVPGSLCKVAHKLHLLAGDPEVSRYEDLFAAAWHKSGADEELQQAADLLALPWRVIRAAAAEVGAELVLVDAGGPLSALARTAVVAADYLVVTAFADQLSVRGVHPLGAALHEWRCRWSALRALGAQPLPPGEMRLLGYLCQVAPIHFNKPGPTPLYWKEELARTYSELLLREPVAAVEAAAPAPKAEDPHCLATLRPYLVLRDLSQELHKPIFDLTPADGAVAGLAVAALDSKREYKHLVRKIAHELGMEMP